MTFFEKSRFLTFSYLWQNHGKGTTKKGILGVFHISPKSIFSVILVIWWDHVFVWMFCTIGKLVWINTKFCETMKCLKNHYSNSITNLIYFLRTKTWYKWINQNHHCKLKTGCSHHCKYWLVFNGFTTDYRMFINYSILSVFYHLNL